MSDIVERLRRQANAMLHPAVRDEMLSIATAIEREQEAHSRQVERANKRFADILDCVDGNRTGEIEKIATRAMLECQGYPLTSETKT